MKINFGFIPIKSQFIKTEEELLKITGNYFNALKNLGGNRWSQKQLHDLNPLLYFVVTGGTERLLLNLLKKRNEIVKNEPVFLIAHPTHNSLPASLEILAKLNQDGKSGKIFYLRSENDNTALEQIVNIITNYNVKNFLRSSKIGLVGEPSDWLVASSPDPNIVKTTWGPEIIPIKMDKVKNALKTTNDEAISYFSNSLTQNAESINEPTTKDIESNVNIYLALQNLIKNYQLNAITIRCFDLVLDIKSTGCFGLSQLNDDGYIAGCEGDLVSTVGMLWVYKLLNQIPWMANPVQLNENKNTLWLAHCTVPRSIVNNYSLRSHFESGIGIGIQGSFSKGPITLLRIGGKKMEKLWLAEGEIIQSGSSEHLCRTQVEIKLSHGSVTELLNAPLGNHLILVKDHHANKLKTWWNEMIPKNIV